MNRTLKRSRIKGKGRSIRERWRRRRMRRTKGGGRSRRKGELKVAEEYERRRGRKNCQMK